MKAHNLMTSTVNKPLTPTSYKDLGHDTNHKLIRDGLPTGLLLRFTLE